jgi:predicted ester cyclase
MTWQEALNEKDWIVASSQLAQDATYNDHAIAALEHELKATWEAAPDLRSEIDAIVVDKGDKAMAARLIHRGTLTKTIHDIEITGRPIEWSEHIFIWTTNNKISRINALIDTQHQASELLPRTPSTLPQNPPPRGFNLETMYHSYISALNSPSIRQLLPDFYQAQLTHTAKLWTIEELVSFVETSPTLFEGLKLSVVDLLADPEGQQVAVRILFEGVPVKPFFGIGPPKEGEKKKVSFFEHAIYKLDGGKFNFIWAMLDLVSYKEQVEG